MRSLFLIVLIAVASMGAQEPDKLARRYGYDVIVDLYPQNTPPRALASVVKAIQNKRIEYLLAHLADPDFVDRRVAEYKTKLVGAEEARTILAFEQLAKETTEHFRGDPLLIKELLKFAQADKEAWDMAEEKASAKLKDLPGRQVFLKKIGDRWFLENRQKPKVEDKK